MFSAVSAKLHSCSHDKTIASNALEDCGTPLVGVVGAPGLPRSLSSTGGRKAGRLAPPPLGLKAESKDRAREIEELINGFGTAAKGVGKGAGVSEPCKDWLGPCPTDAGGGGNDEVTADDCLKAADGGCKTATTSAGFNVAANAWACCSKLDTGGTGVGSSFSNKS